MKEVLKIIFISIYLMSFTVFMYLMTYEELNYICIFDNPSSLIKSTGLITLIGFIVSGIKLILNRKNPSTILITCFLSPIVISLGYILVYKIIVPILYIIGNFLDKFI